ncbi:hypothetical protein SAMN05428947_107237 [Mucilaginibacter sp. OK283]|nr:hypothetical protein SAMN05428947_107237 [Mucilaginibacter sp. OK283]
MKYGYLFNYLGKFSNWQIVKAIKFKKKLKKQSK